MFSLAIWDQTKKKLVLARDRYGEKPLYWSKIDNGLIFASEMKSILAHPSAKKDLNHLAVYQYFSFDYVPQPFTIFKEINKLENGSFLIFENNQITIKRFYNIKIEKSKINFQESKIKLEKLLDNAVPQQIPRRGSLQVLCRHLSRAGGHLPTD